MNNEKQRTVAFGRKKLKRLEIERDIHGDVLETEFNVAAMLMCIRHEVGAITGELKELEEFVLESMPISEAAKLEIMDQLIDRLKSTPDFTRDSLRKLNNSPERKIEQDLHLPKFQGTEKSMIEAQVKALLQLKQFFETAQGIDDMATIREEFESIENNILTWILERRDSLIKIGYIDENKASLFFNQLIGFPGSKVIIERNYSSNNDFYSSHIIKFLKMDLWKQVLIAFVLLFGLSVVLIMVDKIRKAEESEIAINDKTDQSTPEKLVTDSIEQIRKKKAENIENYRVMVKDRWIGMNEHLKKIKNNVEYIDMEGGVLISSKDNNSESDNSEIVAMEERLRPFMISTLSEIDPTMPNKIDAAKFQFQTLQALAVIATAPDKMKMDYDARALKNPGIYDPKSISIFKVSNEQIVFGEIMVFYNERKAVSFRFAKILSEYHFFWVSEQGYLQTALVNMNQGGAFTYYTLDNKGGINEGFFDPEILQGILRSNDMLGVSSEEDIEIIRAVAYMMQFGKVQLGQTLLMENKEEEKELMMLSKKALRALKMNKLKTEMYIGSPDRIRRKYVGENSEMVGEIPVMVNKINRDSINEGRTMQSTISTFPKGRLLQFSDGKHGYACLENEFGNPFVFTSASIVHDGRNEKIHVVYEEKMPEGKNTHIKKIAYVKLDEETDAGRGYVVLNLNCEEISKTIFVDGTSSDEDSYANAALAYWIWLHDSKANKTISIETPLAQEIQFPFENNEYDGDKFEQIRSYVGENAESINRINLESIGAGKTMVTTNKQFPGERLIHFFSKDGYTYKLLETVSKEKLIFLSGNVQYKGEHMELELVFKETEEGRRLDQVAMVKARQIRADGVDYVILNQKMEEISEPIFVSYLGDNRSTEGNAVIAYWFWTHGEGK